jgi:hypothetical protein
MKHLLLLTLFFLVLASGCTSETGRVTDTSHEDGAQDDYEEYVNARETDLCMGVECDITTITCPDGTDVSCRDACDPSTGNCVSCEPLCTGHEAQETIQVSGGSQEEQPETEEEECPTSCRTCQKLSGCRCVTLLDCDGNGICEQGEYPDGVDCEPCPEDTECTSYSFDFSVQLCIPEDTCCGNGACDNDETEETCPQDCFQEEGDITILSVNEIDEYVEIEGYGFILTGWTLKDETEKNIYTFPDGFIINGMVTVHTGTGNRTTTDLYWGRDCPANPFQCVWNNGGDTAYLIDNGEIIDEYSYP